MAPRASTLNLLELLASLTERDSTALQIKLNNYLARAVSARLVFLAIVSRDEEDLLVHVLGDKSLPARVKIAVSTPCFDRALSTKQPTSLKHLDPQQQEDLFKVLYLLHSPAHLAASRQASRSLSTGTPGGGVSPISPSPLGLSKFNPHGEQISPISSRRSNEPDPPRQTTSVTSGRKTKDSRVNTRNIPPSTTSQTNPSREEDSETASLATDPSSSISPEALIADNVYISPATSAAALDAKRPTVKGSSKCGRPERFSLVESPCGSASARYVKPESFLCVPIPNPDPRASEPAASSQDNLEDFDALATDDNSTAVLACFIDKLPTTDRKPKKRGGDASAGNADQVHDNLDFRNKDLDFDERDVECILEFFKYTLPLLLTTLAFEAERRQRNNCQTMLSVAQNLFARLEDVSSLLQEIMSEARSLTDAERCSLFLLDEDKKELVAKVFDGQTSDGSSGSEVRLPSAAGIAGHVATTGRLLNIRDAYTHPLFYRGFDEKTGFRTRNLLCFPIQAGEDHHVIGVAELCNKTTGRFFTQFDEQLATSFSVFCGIAITHSLLYNKVSDAHARIKLSNELMMLHMNVTKDEVDRLTQQEVPEPTELHADFFSFSFFPRVLPEASTPLAVISMITHLGIPQRWSIPAHTLARFVLMVRKGYRDPPYHNWVHAFSVTHFAFLLINNLRLCQTGAISHMEGLALIISCLCHDLDHRGTTNSFQVDSNSVLASLYSSEGSVMERHHLAQAMCILNTESCNIFENLSKEEYTQCLDLMRDIILATDLAHHLRLLGELKRMVSDGYDSNNPRHRHLCICLLMTAADLSDQTKDWQASRTVAKLIYKEFFTQGDLEKAMGNNPLVMMDREKAFIPELQLSFLDNIALPVYKLVADLFPGASVPYESVLESHRRWSQVRDSHLDSKECFGSSLEIFDDDFACD